MPVNNSRCSRCPIDNPEELFLRLRFDWGCLCCSHLKVAHNQWGSSAREQRWCVFRRCSPEHVCHYQQKVRPEHSDETTVGVPPRLSRSVFSPPPNTCASCFAPFLTFLCLVPQTNLAGVRFETSGLLETAEESRVFKTTMWTIGHVVWMPQGLFAWPKISDLRFW